MQSKVFHPLVSLGFPEMPTSPQQGLQHERTNFKASSFPLCGFWEQPCHRGKRNGIREVLQPALRGCPPVPLPREVTALSLFFSFQSLSRDPRGDVAAKTWKLGTSLPPQQNLGGGQGWARGTPGVARPFTFTVGLAQG